MKLILTNILLLLSVFIGQQNNDFSVVIQHVEKDLLSYKPKEALHTIDSVLVVGVRKLSSEEKNILNTLKVEALTKANLFDVSLKLSNKLLKKNTLSVQQKVRILLNNALAFEYVGKFDNCKEKLNEVATLYEQKKISKNELYGQYLYRTSSFYRVQRKYDSLAVAYAEKAKEFSIVNNYKNEGAVASMLLGFLEFNKNPKKAEEHFKTGLQFWKDVDDTHGMGSMYIALGQFKLRKKQYRQALRYCDSAIWADLPANRYGALAYAYKVKSDIFEKTGRLDSALVNERKSQEYTHKSDLDTQEIKVNELQFTFDIEKAILNNEQISKELKEKEKRTNLLLLIVGVLLVSILLFAYLAFRLKRKNSKIKEQQIALNNSVKQKETLLKELHHRVKNNLSMILSLIKLQGNKLKNIEDKPLFKSLEKRIETIAITHNQFLYSQDNKKHGLQKYIEKVMYKLVNLHSNTVTIHSDIENIEVSLDTALPIGLIVNELITNSLKHAEVFEELTLHFSLKKENERIVMCYFDNGKLTKSTSKKDSLGLFLIDTMVKQLNGNYQRNKFKYNFELQLKND